MEKKLTKTDRFAIAFRHQFLQGSWNFERMQNGGWCYAMIPAIRRLYDTDEEQRDALRRHLLFYNTHPYVSAPVMGAVLALEEQRANGEDISDETIQNVKVGMMGPLAGIGDPVFWFSLRPILGAVCGALAIAGMSIGPILFFVLWNVIRFAFLYFAQEYAYNKGADAVAMVSGGLLGKISETASYVIMFVFGVLACRYINVQVSSLQVQIALDAVLPGVLSLVMLLACCFLLKKKMSPVLLIMLIFAFGMVGCLIGIF